MLRFATLLCLFAALAACEQQSAEKPLQYSNAPVGTQLPVNRLVPHPLYNPQKLSEVFQPLVDYLNRLVPAANIQLETSRDYQSFEQKFRSREAEFIVPNPWQTIEAQKVGYHVISMWGDAADFKGIFIVRKDSGIKVPADLKGKVVSYPSPTALAAAIMPQYFLHQNGININTDIQNNYVGSQDSSIMNVYLGQSVAGATWPPPWRTFQKEHPAEADKLKMIWETPSLIN
ncbi:MAG: PhnD/SsuA/transferrin family substrate-binding protein, partial [Gallionellaceae bacterium]